MAKEKRMLGNTTVLSTQLVTEMRSRVVEGLWMAHVLVRCEKSDEALLQRRTFNLSVLELMMLSSSGLSLQAVAMERQNMASGFWNHRIVGCAPVEQLSCTKDTGAPSAEGLSPRCCSHSQHAPILNGMPRGSLETPSPNPFSYYACACPVRYRQLVQMAV